MVLPFIRMEDRPNRIYELRREAGLSQEELGARVGVSKMHISGLERGVRELSLGLMRRLADALDCFPADILSASDNPMRLDGPARNLVMTYRGADPEQQRQIVAVTDALVPQRGRDREAA